MDYRIYHAINQFVYHHTWLGHGLNLLENWAVRAIAIATFALWLLARPGGGRKWKLASASALASAALALLINQLIGKIWHRQRPFATHRGTGPRTTSLPSDRPAETLTRAASIGALLRNRRGLHVKEAEPLAAPNALRDLRWMPPRSTS